MVNNNKKKQKSFHDDDKKKTMWKIVDASIHLVALIFYIWFFKWICVWWNKFEKKKKCVIEKRMNYFLCKSHQIASRFCLKIESFVVALLSAWIIIILLLDDRLYVFEQGLVFIKDTHVNHICKFNYYHLNHFVIFD